jgi:hypothetical protein
VEDYFSDWEYYSDDYHDDDPTVKQFAMKTTAPPAQKKAGRAQAQAKATANRVARPKSSVVPDISSFQGVIWKTPSLDPYQDVAVFYEPIGNKVALLKDWREVFKSAQPALDKSRLRKRKARDQEEDTEDVEADSEMSFADDEFPCDDDQPRDEDQLDSSMSDIVSMDNVSETGDAGEASNTTPEFTQSPKEVPAPAPTSTPAKRGRKRKAEVPVDEPNKDNPGTESPRTTRSKRVASKKGDGEGSLSGASTAPTRRSTRQKK